MNDENVIHYDMNAAYYQNSEITFTMCGGEVHRSFASEIKNVSCPECIIRFGAYAAAPKPSR